MTRRTALKWLHWLAGAFILYFVLVEPDENTADPGGALSTHAGVGMLLGVVTFIWFVSYMKNGPVGRAGPKLPAWAKQVHFWMHRVLYIALPIMVLSGALTGMMAPYAIDAFGVVPLSLGIDIRWLHSLLEELHELAFDGLLIIIVVHILFHLWRQFVLRDNALRIILPIKLHKYLK
ncbi:hypothetical protein GCM10007939_11770 [Amylibacter marinus]|uniref:Cytochrome b561 bacterial/Ni-hydrogenase domain-containing protein n=1 Tax=Amylibacter marinus TaxID=1475483 RepID=A0ABQ5VUT3_9RHOB|nr:cytochrome b/b6 domain-containing protein [Amylibacter marinus]GLQ34894.1 hypothetical protein GCM10007939_11770 [Amylibacter marinus]